MWCNFPLTSAGYGPIRIMHNLILPNDNFILKYIQNMLYIVPKKVFLEPSETVLYLFKGALKSSRSYNLANTDQKLTNFILSEGKL